jgi:hypothetical protein
MRRGGAFTLGLCIAYAMAGACGSDDSSPSGATGGGGSVTSGASGGGGRSGSGGAGTSGATGGAAGARGCERFGFVASGSSCASSGCGSFGCSCPGAFPKSIAKCTADGCLVSADCTAVCAEDLGVALSCTASYTVAPTRDAGGTAGSGGSGGAADAAVPMCSSSDVHVAATSAAILGTAPLSGAKLLGDDSGALYVAASVQPSSPVDLGGGELAAGKGIVLFKLNPAHQHVWSRRIGANTSIDGVATFSFAQNGDLLLGGTTGFQTDLGGGPEPSFNGAEIYVARYDRDGKFVRRYLLPTSNVIPVPVSVVEQPSGDVLIFGTFSTTWTAGSTSLVPAGESDIYVLRYSAAGTLLDARRYGRARNDLVFDAVAAPDGSIYLVGFSYYAVDFGQNPIELGMNSTSWVVRLDATLTPVWQKIIGGGGAYPRRAFLDGSMLVVAGDSYSTVSYGNSGDAGGTSWPKANLFVLRVNAPDGALARGDTYEHKGSGARVTALAHLPTGGIAVGGYLQPPGDFGGGDLTSSLKGYQSFVASYDVNGQHLWSTFFCSTQLAGGAAGAVGGIARDGDSTVLLLPFNRDFELGSQRFAGSFGTILADMPPDP